MKIKTIFAVVLFLNLIACNNDDDTPPVKSSEKAITVFSFSNADNSALSIDVKGIIDKDKKIISVELPEGTATTALKPTIVISENATVDPKNKTAIDFSKPVMYTVTADDESTAKYTVTVTVKKSSDKQITSFKFSATDNGLLSKDIEAMIDEANKTITAELPYNVSLKALTPTLEISSGAEVNPKDKVVTDFTNDVSYTVTAEDGSTEKYTVTIESAAITDRDVLIAWYNLNPNNTLTWDFSKNISEWEDITVENNRVTKINIRDKGLSLTTPLIEFLTELNSLQLVENQISSLPIEIGNSKKLKALNLNGNNLTELPKEIGNLLELQLLQIRANKLGTLPSELGNLIKLKELSLPFNELTGLPIELGLLKELLVLNLYGNRGLTSIPKEIGDLTKLASLNIGYCSLSTVPTVIGNLTSLEELKIDENQLTTIPKEIGNLSNLTRLELQKNQLTELPSELGKLSGLLVMEIQENQITLLPKEICDLDDANLILVKDPETKCPE